MAPTKLLSWDPCPFHAYYSSFVSTQAMIVSLAIAKHIIAIIRTIAEEIPRITMIDSHIYEYVDERQTATFFTCIDIYIYTPLYTYID